MRTEVQTRTYLHGDVAEDGKTFYDRRADAFVRLKGELHITAIDVWKYKEMKKDWDARVKAGRTRRRYRPRGAPNVFAEHLLMNVHPSTLRSAMRKAYEEERHVGRPDREYIDVDWELPTRVAPIAQAV